MLVVVGLSSLLLAVELVQSLSGRSERLAASIPLPNEGTKVLLEGGAQVCERDVTLNEGTRRLRLFAGRDGPPAGPLRVELRKGSEVLARGRVPPGIRTGPVEARLDRTIDRDHRLVTICIANAGPRPVSFGGADTLPRAQVDGRIQDGRMRIEYLRDGEESWTELAPALADRFVLSKAGFFGGWTFWVVWAVMGGLWASTAALIVRTVR